MASRLLASSLVVATLLVVGRAGAGTETLVWLDADDGIPFPRWDPVLTYDEVNGEPLLFSDYYGAADTWLWNGSRWVAQHPAHAPLERGVAADDSARQRIVFFEFTGDTWEWGGLDWTKISSVHKPTPVSHQQMFFDASSGRTILFSGQYGTPHTWAWDGTDWTDLAPAHSPNDVSCAAYDATRNRGVLLELTSTNVSQTWEWDGTDWTLTSPTQVIPGRTDCMMTYDETRQVTIAYGGFDTSNTEITDQWAWNGTTWTQYTGTPPFGRDNGGFTYDKGCACDLLFGGNAATNGNSLVSTWQFDASGWSDHSVYDRPPSNGSYLAYDTTSSRSVLFTTGDWLDADTESPTPSTWTWDGATWSKIVTQHWPSPTGTPTFTFDRARSQVVMLVGKTGETWLFDGLDWSKANPTTVPSGLDGAAATYDTTRNVTVVYGGSNNATWEWDGSDWQHVQPVKSPIGRTRTTMAYDEAHQCAVMFGGQGSTQYLYDTWTYDGTTWTQQTPNKAPKVGGKLVYDAARKRTLLLQTYPNSPGAVWEWDGTDWGQVGSMSFSPVAMAYDSARSRTVFFGTPSGYGTETDQTTELVVRGGTCVTSADCDTGYCEDGTCCMTSCGGAGDCRVCSIAAGGTDDGICVIAASGSTCRASAGSCDIPETCDGTSDACPANAYVDAGVPCAAASCVKGVVTPSATCTGSSPDCPTSASVSCAPYLCDADGGCLSTCTTDDDCVAGFVCVLGQCVGKDAGIGDAGASGDDGGDGGNGNPGDLRGGCSCSVPRAHSTGSREPLVVGALALLLAWRRRSIGCAHRLHRDRPYDGNGTSTSCGVR